MKLNVINHSSNNSMSINKRIADMMLSQYKKGLQILNQEENPEENESDNGNESTIINPTKKINIPIQKPNNKSYSVKKTDNNNLNLKSMKTKVKEFITQSKALDNELDSMILELKLNNKAR